MNLPAGHKWIHNGALHFTCKCCNIRIIREYRKTKSGGMSLICFLVSNDGKLLNKIPISCTEVKMQEALG